MRINHCSIYSISLAIRTVLHGNEDRIETYHKFCNDKDKMMLVKYVIKHIHKLILEGNIIIICLI